MSSYVKAAIKEISKFIEAAINLISDNEINSLVETLIEAYRSGRKVLIVGAGRSGLVGRAFAMRLMHLGFNVYVLGETITPRLDVGDVVIAISGSGRTRLVVTAAEVARSIGAKIIAVTSHPDSPLAKLADLVVRIPGRTKVATEEDYIVRQLLGMHEPLTPLGTLFENTALAVLDGVIVELMKRLGVSEEELKLRHANIE
ncbi:MAG: 6-phospho-3-hexuloisomerase [Thermoprotei archaeon]|nr:MAG: 6-phospho-3-hexuloisomerase [Thermoprotei archaeon]